MKAVQVYEGAGESGFPLLPGFVPVMVMHSDFSVPFEVYMIHKDDLARFEGQIDLDRIRNNEGAKFNDPAFQFEVSIMDKAGVLWTMHEVIRVDDKDGYPRFFADRIE